MGQDTQIEWTDHTFNPWWGCQKVSTGCDHCYAAAFDHRLGGQHWGVHATYRTQNDDYWSQPLRWHKAALKAGERRRVFCASMADVFDTHGLAGERQRLWALIRQTPQLDWLLLTKRPANFRKMLPPDWGKGWPHVWLGVSAENALWAARRIPLLQAVPATVRFLSIEPLLGPIPQLDLQGIAWVICGGESGPDHRPIEPAWVRSIRDQCQQAGVAFFFKQWGGRQPKSGGKLLDGREWCDYPPGTQRQPLIPAS
jgi:protein gp37